MPWSNGVGFGRSLHLRLGWILRGGVFLAKDSLGEVVEFPGFELHGFWDWGVRWVRASIPCRSVAWGGDVGRVGGGNTCPPIHLHGRRRPQIRIAHRRV